MVRCAVFCCNSHNDKRLTRNGGRHRKISHFRFPKNKAMAQLWKSKCGRPTRFSLANARICDEHFVPDDFEKTPKGSLRTWRRRRRLKTNAIPSINLPVSKIEVPEPIKYPQMKIPELKQHSKIDKEIMAESPDDTMDSNLLYDMEMINKPKCQNPVCAEIILSLELEIKILRKENEELELCNEKLFKQNKQLVGKIDVAKNEPFDKLFESLESMQAAFCLHPLSDNRDYLTNHQIASRMFEY